MLSLDIYGALGSLPLGSLSEKVTTFYSIIGIFEFCIISWLASASKFFSLLLLYSIEAFLDGSRSPPLLWRTWLTELKLCKFGAAAEIVISTVFIYEIQIYYFYIYSEVQT